MSSLNAALETLTQDDDGFVIDAPPDWSQGRTLYGGMTAALAHEAVRRTQSDLPPLRSAQLAFIGPASGKLRFSSTLLRRGRSSAVVASDCLNEEGPAARALFVFGAARESKVAHQFLPMPEVAAPQECRPFRKEGTDAPRGFFKNFETRIAAGARLLDGGDVRPEFAVWTRFLDAGPANPTTAMLAFADCLPPAAMTVFPQPAPISTMTWTVDIAHTPASLDGWHLLWAASEQAGEGYTLQNMAMWDASGTLIATGRQVVAIFV